MANRFIELVFFHSLCYIHRMIHTSFQACSGVLVIAGVALLFSSCGSSPPRQNPNMIADINPIEIGTITLQFDKLLSSSIETKEAKVFFDPRINAVYLTFKYQTLNYLQYWDKPNREAFIAAFERYKSDYNAAALIAKDSKSRAIYGELQGMTVWSTLPSSFSERVSAYPKIHIGYSFKKTSSGQLAPYFSTLQLEAKAEADSSGSDNAPTKTSLRIRMYYTRAQAETLAAYFDDNFLMGLVRDFAKSRDVISADDDYFNRAEAPAPQIQADDIPAPDDPPDDPPDEPATEAEAARRNNAATM
ncbi:MAG: hypothetical protein LBG43_02235 [Treponema sp.]|jgi:hypothetical protein|nr:hypothetical protein [Treponema sp.]